uniref:Chemosensory protein n=1 Tax=Blattella germanica TaxID=6973 RepID=A0A109QFS3_BLAGE|nr:chemosensory protein [Blattella germanica]
MVLKRIKLILFLSFISVTFSLKPEEIGISCQQKYKLSGEDIVEMRENRMILKDETNVNQRCFIECLMVESNMFVNGELNQEEVKKGEKELKEFYKSHGKELNLEKFDTSIQECSSKDDEGQCMKSYQMWKCLVSAMV